MSQLTLYTPEMPWEDLSLFSGNARSQYSSLRAGRRCEELARALISGTGISPHDHIGIVQLYVIEGEYETLGETFGAGTYRLLPSHADVGTMTAWYKKLQDAKGHI